MTNITLKNIPEAVYARLKQQASKNRRSLNSEAIVCLESALFRSAQSAEEFLAKTRQIRETVGMNFDPDDIAAAIREGRE